MSDCGKVEFMVTPNNAAAIALRLLTYSAMLLFSVLFWAGASVGTYHVLTSLWHEAMQ